MISLLSFALPALLTFGPDQPTADLDRLPPQAAKLYSAVKQAHPGELKWQQIPWLTDLDQGIRIAKEEVRALLIFASGDDPLEKC